MCDICGRSSCADWMHSQEEQKRYEKVIEAFERARDMRRDVSEQHATEKAEDSE